MENSVNMTKQPTSKQGFCHEWRSGC